MLAGYWLMSNSPLEFLFSFVLKSKSDAYSSLKQVMWKKNSGLQELCTNMKGWLGNKAVIKFSYNTVSRFVMLIDVSFMSGI